MADPFYEQVVLGADFDGNFTGEYIPRHIAHTGKGKHHLAISVLIYNSRGEVLIQRRKHKVFDNIWDMTASTHQLHRSDGTDETDEEATLRALKEEYQIDNVKLKNYGGVNYFEEYGEFCENEFDKMLVGEYNGPINMDPKVGYEYKWMKKEEFLKDVEQNPKKYTPWTIEGVKYLKEKNFF